MNNEACARRLVERKAPAYIYTIEGMTISLYVIDAFLALTTVWGILILTAIGTATFLVFQGTNLELEYLVVSDQLTIDKITGKVRRKKTWEGITEEVQIAAPSDPYMLKDYKRVGMKTLDFFSRASGVKTYNPIHQAGANMTKVTFEPSDRVLHCLRMRSPRKVTQQYDSLKF